MSKLSRTTFSIGSDTAAASLLDDAKSSGQIHNKDPLAYSKLIYGKSSIGVLDKDMFEQLILDYCKQYYELSHLQHAESSHVYSIR